MRAISILVLLALASCVSGNKFSLERLPTFDAAVALRNPTLPPSRIITVTDAVVPKGELIPFATFAGSSQLSLQGRLERMIDETIEFMPDAYSYAEGTDQQVGTVSQYIGFGVTSSSPIMATPCRLILLREAPSILPIQLNEQGMILAIQAEGHAQGLQEGDTVLSLNGVAIETDPARRLHSQWWVERLGIKPGETVSLVAVRPGTGRITGSVTALPNPRTYLAAPSIPEASKITVHPNTRNGSPCWSIRPARSHTYPD